MSMLSLIWLLALAVMAGIVFSARTKSGENMYEGKRALRLGDLASKEAHLLLRDTVSLVNDIRPHGARAFRSGLVFVRRGQDFFIARVYGKMQMQKGSASSFFLKQIAEHQGQSVGRARGAREM